MQAMSGLGSNKARVVLKKLNCWGLKSLAGSLASQHIILEQYNLCDGAGNWVNAKLRARRALRLVLIEDQ